MGAGGAVLYSMAVRALWCVGGFARWARTWGNRRLTANYTRHRTAVARHKLVELITLHCQSAGVTVLEWLQVTAFGRISFEALMLAILRGAIVRTARWFSGIKFGAHTLPEVAVVLLGRSVAKQAILAIGPALLGGIAVVMPWSATEWADCSDCRPEWRRWSHTAIQFAAILPSARFHAGRP